MASTKGNINDFQRNKIKQASPSDLLDFMIRTYGNPPLDGNTPSGGGGGGGDASAENQLLQLAVETDLLNQLISLNVSSFDSSGFLNNIQSSSASTDIIVTDSNSKLSSILAKLNASIAITASTLPLPTGASTETTLASLNGKVTTCNTSAVVISSGTVTTVTTVTTLANGQTAHSTASTGSPLRIGGRVLPASPDTTLVAGDASDIGVTKGQQQVFKYNGDSDNDFNMQCQILNSSTPITIAPARGASLRSYIVSIKLTAETLVGSELQVRDGAVTSSSVAANVMTSGTHDYKVGDMVIFSNIASYVGIVVGVPYWVLTTPSSTTYTLSAVPFGTTLAITGTGSAVSKRILYASKIIGAQTPFIEREINMRHSSVRSAPNQPLEIVTLTPTGAGNMLYVGVQGYINV